MKEAIGHGKITLRLKKEIEMGKIGSAYMFSGQRSIGKRLVAEQFARGALCQERVIPPCGLCSECLKQNNPDVIILGRTRERIDVGSIRELIKISKTAPLSSRRFFIIDDAHLMTKSAFSALLKTLEEPLPFNTFVLVTSRPSDIPPTIKSRCRQYHFSPLSESDFLKVLELNDITPKSELYVLSGGNVSLALEISKHNLPIDTLLHGKPHEIIDAIESLLTGVPLRKARELAELILNAAEGKISAEAENGDTKLVETWQRVIKAKSMIEAYGNVQLVLNTVFQKCVE